MGLTKSKEVNQDLALFSPEEQESLQLTVTELLNGKKHIDPVPLKKWLLSDMPLAEMERLVDRLCDLMLKASSSVNLDNFLHVASVMVKGMTEEKSGVLIYLASGHKHHATLEDVVEFCKLVLRFYLKVAHEQNTLKSWNISSEDEQNANSLDRLATCWGNELSLKGVASRELVGEAPSLESKYDAAAVSVWLNKCHQFVEVLDIFAHRLFRLPWSPTVPLVPLCVGAPQNAYTSWLGVGDLLLVNSALPLELRGQWRFIFSTAVHGESFSSLLGHIVDKGPTVIIIRDNKGHVFGGFASTSWTVNPHFTGTEKNFVFSLNPRMAVYSSTGFNNHHQYLNIQQQTFPNGLGMGGQLNYFGFWIDAEFGKGYCSPTCTTYGCPQLSAEANFQIDRLEVWGVGPEPVKEEEEHEPRPSILDVDMEGAAMLKMLNRGPVSEGLRETPTADSPEEKELPPLELTY